MARHSGDTDPTTPPRPRLHLMVFRDVPAPLEVKRAILAGDFPACVLVNAGLIADVAQLLSATSRSLVAMQEGSAVTKTLYSEILFNLSPLTNIGESMRLFGASDKLRNALVFFVQPEPPSPETIQTLHDKVGGVQGRIEDLPTLTDWAAVERVFKLDPAQRTHALPLILGALALKGHL